MRIIYNGIDLFVQETHQYDMECVMDDTGTDYLYTRHMIVARCVVNGQASVYASRFINGQWFRNGPAITYNFLGGSSVSTQGPGGSGGPVKGVQPPGTIADGASRVGPPPIGDFGTQRADPTQPVLPRNGVVGSGITPTDSGLSASNTNQLFEVVSTPIDPTTSIRVIRHRLTTPRGRLFIFSGGWDGDPATGPAFPAPVMVMSPDTESRCDCKNGPIPRILSTPKVFGDATTFILDFAVETYINESVQNGVYAPGALLSNRFKQVHTVGQDSYTTINTDGMAIFRTDWVYRLPASPDCVRPLLTLPIPRGFQRENVVVEGLPDVAGVRYAFQDRQVPSNFVAGPYVKAAKISAVHRQGVTNNSFVLEGALSAYERILGVAANKNIAKQPTGDEQKQIIAKTGQPRTVKYRPGMQPPGSAIIPTGAVPGPRTGGK